MPSNLFQRFVVESCALKDDTENTALHWSRGRLEQVPTCPACGSGKRSGLPLACTDHRTDLRDETWHLSRCAACRSLYLDPRPDGESLPRAYEVYYTHDEANDASPPQAGIGGLVGRFVHGYLNHRFGMTRQPASRWGVAVFCALPPLRQKLDYYGRHLYPRDFPQRGRLLDVGCGSGAFLARAVEMGWQVNGLDPDPAAVAVCTGQGLNVVQGTLRDAPAKWAGQFDVVTMSHSIEHVTQPGAELKQVYSLLRPGGVLWLACPNPDSLGSRIYARAWRGLHAPYHLVIPSAPQLSRLLLDAGFVHPVRVRRGAHARWMMQESAENARHAGGRSMQARAWFAPLFRILADVVASAVPGGAEETVIMARRPEQP